MNNITTDLCILNNAITGTHMRYTTNANCSNLAAIETWQVEKNAACMPSGFKDGLATQTWIVVED